MKYIVYILLIFIFSSCDILRRAHQPEVIIRDSIIYISEPTDPENCDSILQAAMTVQKAVINNQLAEINDLLNIVNELRAIPPRIKIKNIKIKDTELLNLQADSINNLNMEINKHVKDKHKLLNKLKNKEVNKPVIKDKSKVDNSTNKYVFYFYAFWLLIIAIILYLTRRFWLPAIKLMFTKNL